MIPGPYKAIDRRPMGSMLLTIRQAAEHLACSPKMVRRAIDRGELKCVRIGESARSDRIHPEDLEAFITTKRGRRGRRIDTVKSRSRMSTSTESALERALGKMARTNRPKPKKATF